MPPPHSPRTMVRVEAAGQIYKKVKCFIYVGGAVTETLDISVEIARWTRVCWMCIRWYLPELYDQPKGALSLKTRLTRPTQSRPYCTDAVVRGPFARNHYSKFCTIDHRVLLRITGVQRKRPDHGMPSYNRAPEITRCESIETSCAREDFCGRGCSSE